MSFPPSSPSQSSSSSNPSYENDCKKSISSCCCSSKKNLQESSIVSNNNSPSSSSVSETINNENRPKPIPAPPMNDQCREYCKKVLHDLLEEHHLLNDFENSVENSTCCGGNDSKNQNSEKWPKYMTLCGIGSLLSEKSARRTFPDLINFRKGIVKNHVRCFNLVAISSLNFGDLEKRKIAAVSAVSHLDLEMETIEKVVQGQQSSRTTTIVNSKNQEEQKLEEKQQDIEMYCSLFEIPLTEQVWCAYMTREHRYEFKFVTIDQDFREGSMKRTCSCCGSNCKCSELSSCGCKALLCCQFNDDSYRSERCSSYENEFHERVAQHFEGRLWYHTKHVSEEKHIHRGEIPIKPIPKYLELCLGAALEMGSDVFENFMQTSVMADGVTLLEDYLKVEEPELFERFITKRL